PRPAAARDAAAARRADVVVPGAARPAPAAVRARAAAGAGAGRGTAAGADAGGLEVRAGLELVPHGTEGDEARAQPGELARADPLCQPGVDARHTLSHLGCGGSASCRGLDQHPPAVVRIGTTLEVAAGDEGADELSRRLLRDAELPDELPGGRAVVR